MFSLAVVPYLTVFFSCINIVKFQKPKLSIAFCYASIQTKEWNKHSLFGQPFIVDFESM